MDIVLFCEVSKVTVQESSYLKKQRLQLARPLSMLHSLRQVEPFSGTNVSTSNYESSEKDVSCMERKILSQLDSLGLFKLF